MFSCCDLSSTTEKIVDLDETTGTLNALLRILHFPPEPPVELVAEEGEAEQARSPMQTRPTQYDQATVIPLPLIQLLLRLVDKYALPQSTVQSLGLHLQAHATSDALQVYGLATSYGMDRVASDASQHLMPLASYGMREISVIPTVGAYHKIVRLQDYRIKALRELVLTEEIFPHGMS